MGSGICLSNRSWMVLPCGSLHSWFTLVFWYQCEVMSHLKVEVHIFLGTLVAITAYSSLVSWQSQLFKKVKLPLLVEDWQLLYSYLSREKLWCQTSKHVNWQIVQELWHYKGPMCHKWLQIQKYHKLFLLVAMDFNRNVVSTYYFTCKYLQACWRAKL